MRPGSSRQPGLPSQVPGPCLLALSWPRNPQLLGSQKEWAGPVDGAGGLMAVGGSHHPAGAPGHQGWLEVTQGSCYPSPAPMTPN